MMKWESMMLGRKIAVGFGVVLILLVLVEVLIFTGVSRIVANADQVIHGHELDGVLAQKEVDHLNWAKKVNALLTDEAVTKLEVETDSHKCGFGKWLYGEGRSQAEALIPDLAALLKAIEEPHQRLHESAIEIGKAYRQADPDLSAFLVEKEVDHLKWAAKVRDALLRDSKSLDVETDPTRCALGKWINGDQAKNAYARGDADYRKIWDSMLVRHKELHESAVEIQGRLLVSHESASELFEQKTLPAFEETLRLLGELKTEADHELAGMAEAKKIYINRTVPPLEQTQALLNEIRTEAKKHIMADDVMINAAQRTKRNVTGIGVVAVAVGVLMAFFISRGIVSALRRVSGEMDEGASHVSAASGEISAASQSLAEGASEQAASIEETSSSLEEMSSMTQQNADNANQANHLMQEADRTIRQAYDSMTRLTASMSEISKASEETSKIIKTIDEIAFQTNLLALNAAVEAARAGEAGAGFAVVADEVRNLAMRAADAAKNTAGLIEGTVKKVNDGSELVSRTNKEFSEVADSAAKVRELVGEIAAASQEQAQGIEQLNKAVAEMDKVVQQSASNAEQTASASEQMNARSAEMKGVVAELVKMVGGAAIENGNVRPRNASRPALAFQVNKSAAKKVVPARRGEVRPDQMIPMGEEDF